jgi:hypothetical protein
LYADDETDERQRRSLVVTTFSAAGETLHACAVESRADEARAGAGTQAALQRVASGFSRMLAQ